MRAQLQKQMYELVRKFQSSGQTQQDFCQTHGLKLHKLQYWNAKYLQEQQLPKTGFAELKISPSVSSASSTKLLVIRMSNGTIIEIPV